MAAVAAVTVLLSISLQTLANGNAQNSFYHVRDHGAKGDGISLDTKAINATIEAASRTGGGTVYFSAAQPSVM